MKTKRYVIVTLLVGIAVVAAIPAKEKKNTKNQTLNVKTNPINWSKSFNKNVHLNPEYLGENIDYTTPIPTNLPVEIMRKIVSGELSIEDGTAPYIK